MYRHVKQYRPQCMSLRHLSCLVHKPTVHSHSFFPTFKRVLIHQSTFPFALWHLCFQNLCFEFLLRNIAACLLENHITAGICGASGLDGNGMKALRAKQGAGTSCPASLCQMASCREGSGVPDQQPAVAVEKYPCLGFQDYQLQCLLLLKNSLRTRHDVPPKG